MSIDPQLVGTVQVLAGVVSLAFLKPVFGNPDTPGCRSFGLFVIGTALWMAGVGASNFTPDFTLSMVTYNVVMLGAEVVSAAFLLLALNVTERAAIARKIRPVLAGGILVLQLLVWTNPFHYFVFGTGSHVDGVLLSLEYAPGFWLHAVLSYLCGFAALLLLVIEAIRSVGIRRKQALLLAVGAVPTIVANLISLFDLLQTPYDITPFGYLLTEAVLVLVLFNGQFLRIAPVARRTAMAEMADAMITLDDDNQVVDANRQARSLFGVGEDYIGMPAADFFAPVSQDILAQFADTTRTDTEITAELDGQQRHFSLSISPVGKQTTRGRVVLLHDITTQKHREQELKRKNDRLDQFASVVSHDLRNPLGIAETYIDFAEDTNDADDFQAVRDAHDRMETMIDELLLMARAETVVDDPEEIMLASLATDAWETAQTDGGSVDIALPNDTAIYGDPDLLRHVFENLFRNAVDHNEPPVTVTVGLCKDGVYIADDGTGIPDDQRNNIFDYGYTTSENGTGFGLSIVGDIINAHSGEIAVTESGSSGARFEITSIELTTKVKTAS